MRSPMLNTILRFYAPCQNRLEVRNFHRWFRMFQKINSHDYLLKWGH